MTREIIVKKKHKKFNPFPTIGKYIDTPSKAELKVIYFLDDVGNFKLSGGTLPGIILRSCRFQVQSSDVKSQHKFYKKLQPFLEISASYGTLNAAQVFNVPFVFGLLKIRKGKQRKFILIQAAEQFFKSKVINITAVVIDNLLYLDLVNKLKKKA